MGLVRALATGLKTRIAEMEGRLTRLQDRSSKRRQVVKEVMLCSWTCKATRTPSRC
jgi:hypothetical protein